MDALIKTFVDERIERIESNILNSRTKITTINDEFKDWYRSIHGNTKGCEYVMKDMKAYLEKRFGKYPTNGWSVIRISEEAYHIPDLTEEMIVIQKINGHMSNVNLLIQDLLELKTQEMQYKIDKMQRHFEDEKGKVPQYFEENQMLRRFILKHKKSIAAEHDELANIL